jgi:hypothetical protein
MPSIGGAMAAIIAGWLIDGMFEGWLDSGATFALSLVGSTVVFFLMRNWLRRLRDG